MEVHHHPDLHHKRKKIREYLLEGFMIFIAVMLGFFAESIREYIHDRSVEKEYIVSMVKELKADSTQLADALADNSVRYKKLDTLALLILSKDYSPEKMKKIYKLMDNTGLYYPMIFDRNTLTQLKSSGNMRLIRKAGVVDSLNALDNLISMCNIEIDTYAKLMHDQTKESAGIFDESYFIKDGKWLNGDSVLTNIKELKFLTTDKKKLITFGTQLYHQSGMLQYYFYMLQDYSDFSNRLISFLEKKYDLNNEELKINNE